MKYKKLAIFVENEKGKFYRVALSEHQENIIVELLFVFHKDKIKIRRGAYPFSFK